MLNPEVVACSSKLIIIILVIRNESIFLLVLGVEMWLAISQKQTLSCTFFYVEAMVMEIINTIVSDNST